MRIESISDNLNFRLYSHGKFQFKNIAFLYKNSMPNLIFLKQISGMVVDFSCWFDVINCL